MLGSTLVYSALLLTCAGLVAVIRPLPGVRLHTRARGLAVAIGGLTVACGGLLLPAFESRTRAATMRLDEFAPAWQFHEVHTIRIAAPPARVYEAIKGVRADEIFLFRTLTWIRRAGRPLPPGILNAGSHESLLAVATKGGFIWLADEAPREIVVGAVVAPRRPRAKVTADFVKSPPPGFTVAAMNFVVTPDGPAGSLVTTETRVFASSPAARRVFAAYWRVIYPGSATIRRMWLREIARRALGLSPTPA